jgi:hypothetical protein
LPYHYVLEAVRAASRSRRTELHENERPISYLLSQNAEVNRDTKKRKKPYSMDDFYLYQDPEDADRGPNGRYGAAAMELIKQSLMPHWALFVYKDLKSRATEANPPELLAFMHPSAIVLAPSVADNQCSGMLIATEEASGKTLTMESPCGKTVRIQIPQINNKVYAEEDCVLTAFT